MHNLLMMPVTPAYLDRKGVALICPIGKARQWTWFCASRASCKSPASCKQSRTATRRGPTHPEYLPNPCVPWLVQGHDGPMSQKYSKQDVDAVNE